MRNRCIFAGVVVAWFLACGFVSAANDELLSTLDGDVIARIHFAGTTRISADPAATKLNEFADLPETTVLRKRTLDKLSTAPFRLVPFKAVKGDTNEFATLLRPLLDDLMNEESYIEVRNAGVPIPEVLMAVRLNHSRAKAWNENLSKVLSEWTGISVKSIKDDGYSGWELRKQDTPNVVRYLRAGDWVLFGWGMNTLHSEAEFLQNIKAHKRPGAEFTEGWLDAAVDVAALMHFHNFDLSIPLPSSLPKVHLNMLTRKDYVRPKMVMEFPQPLDLKLEPWKIPTNAIRTPLVSFTAIRGIAPWLARFPIIKDIQPPSLPNQLVFWSMGRVLYENNVMAPMPGASNYVAQIAPPLKTTLESYFKSNKMYTTVEWTNHVFAVKGLAFIMPTLRAFREPTGEYIRGEEFPVGRPPTNSTPFPKELMQQIKSQPNLVCYSWEITAEHGPQWQSLHIVDLMERSKPLPPHNSPGMQWLRAAKSKLGNCATEVNLTGPSELTAIRNSPIGLNGLEITALQYWLDAPGFPWNCEYPKTRPPGRRQRQNPAK